MCQVSGVVRVDVKPLSEINSKHFTERKATLSVCVSRVLGNSLLTEAERWSDTSSDPTGMYNMPAILAKVQRCKMTRLITMATIHSYKGTSNP